MLKALLKERQKDEMRMLEALLISCTKLFVCYEMRMLQGMDIKADARDEQKKFPARTQLPT